MSDLTLINVGIFDGESEQLRDGPIQISNGVITKIGERDDDSGSKVLDGQGGVVTPGLIDAHFHAYAIDLDGMQFEGKPLSYAALAAAQRLSAALARGFTTVRDVAGGDIGLAMAIESGQILAPHYLYTGPGLCQTGGHGDFRPNDLEIHFCGQPRLCEVVDGVENLRKAVRERLRLGAHAIKIFTSGGVLTPDDPLRNPQYSAEEVSVVAEEAGRRGSYVAAHAYSPEAIEHSVRNGVRSIEHGNLLDGPTAALMAELQAYLVPTLAAYDALDRRGPELGLSAPSLAKNREVLDAGFRAVELARAAGVPVGWGSDLMGELEDEQLHGLRAQAETDGALNTLRSATTVNARLLQRSDLGRIACGCRGDLVLYSGNPLEDPSVLWEASKGPQAVVLDGRVVASRPHDRG